MEKNGDKRIVANEGSAGLLVFAGLETAGRRCLKLPFGEHHHRLVNVPLVLRTAAHCNAGLLSPLLRRLARPEKNSAVKGVKGWQLSFSIMYERIVANEGSARAKAFLGAKGWCSD